MNIAEANEKANFIRRKFLEMQKITFIDYKEFKTNEETGSPFFTGTEKMDEVSPSASKKLNDCWEEIQKAVPPGFSVDGNLIRHLSFNEAHDWADISHHDIPRELGKIMEYKKQLVLVEYLGLLHPEVGRVAEIVLNGDIEIALKGVFSNLESKIRASLSVLGSEPTVPLIAKAFKNGLLIPPQPENLEGVRNFLMGVIGYYRHTIIHKPLSPKRNRIEASLSLFAIAHEAFQLLDVCARELINLKPE